MKTNFKSNAGLFWVIGVIVASMVVFVYLLLSDAPRTLPKISLSYFVSEDEIVQSIEKRLHLELLDANQFWIGIEPDKKEQHLVVQKLVELLDKKSPFKAIIADKELQLTNDEMKMLGVTEVHSVKEEIFQLGEKIEKFELEKTPYVVITASIYSTSMLPGNPIHKLKSKNPLNATTFSMAYFTVDLEDEKKLLFNCNTEDHSGIKDWGCFVVNKARTVRRKLNLQNPKPWIGLMDMSGEHDYVLLLKKK
jgi:hypothetical protein